MRRADATDHTPIGRLLVGVNDGSSPALSNVDVRASCDTASSSGLDNAGGAIRVRGSSITGTSFSVSSSSSTARIADTMLNGAVTGQTYVCIGVYNQNFVVLGSACQ